MRVYYEKSKMSHKSQILSLENVETTKNVWNTKNSIFENFTRFLESNWPKSTFRILTYLIKVLLR